MEWRRADLHLHTPGSRDYQERGATYLDILRKAEAEGLDIIAFTDHNTVAGYAAMKEEIADLEHWEEAGRILPAEKERLAEYRRLLDEILVLPGFEFTATFGFHIMAIFDPATPIRAIEHVLLSLDVPIDSLEKGEMEVGATTDVLTAYQKMADAGALVIAAHANSSSGVAMVGLGFGGQTKIAYTQDPHLHALEVTDLEAKRRRTTASFFNGSKPEYPRRMHCIQGSDAHRVTGQPGSRQNLGVGERAIEVQLQEVSFEALKELFLSSEFHRTRPYRRQAEPYDFVEEARKEGPSIVQSFHEQVSRQGGRLHAVLRDVVAMANANGGTVYVGVGANVKAPPKGVEDVENSIAELRTDVERQVTPPLEVSISTTKSHGKDIVRVEVPKGPDQPYAIEGSRIYVRREAETSLAMRDEIVGLIRRLVYEEIASGQAPTAAEAQGERVPEQARAAGNARPSEPPRQGRPRRGEGAREAGRARDTQRVPAAEPAGSEPAGAVVQAGSAAKAGDAGRRGDGEADQAQPKDAEPAAAPPSGESEKPAIAEAQGQNGHSREAPPAGEYPGPRTGVEIVESVERNGVLYHTMRDLRDGAEVHNVTRASARRLWRYAIHLQENHTFSEDKVTWVHNGLGLWHKYLRAGRPHYDLVQRQKDGTVRIYYGVSDDGIDGIWRQVVGQED